MLWICSCLVSTKEVFLKIAAPKRQIRSLKSNCEVVIFYYICKLYTWNLLQTIFSQAFLKDFARAFLKDFAYFPLYEILKNRIIYFAEAFWCFCHYQFTTLLFSLFYQNLGSASFKEHLPVVVSVKTYLKVTPKYLK